MLRLLAQRVHAHSDAVLLERELAIYRSQRQRRQAKRRPHFAPRKRSEILQFTEGGDLEPEIMIERRHVGGDQRLLYPVIGVNIQDRFAA